MSWIEGILVIVDVILVAAVTVMGKMLLDAHARLNIHMDIFAKQVDINDDMIKSIDDLSEKYFELKGESNNE